VDTSGVVAESNEGNNVRSENWTWVSLAKPDLIVDDLWSTSEPLHTGQAENVSFRIKNVGNGAAAGRFYTKVWVAGTEVGTWATDGLNAGASATGSVNVTVNSAGVKEVKGQVDTSGVVAESNEGNNVRSENWTWVSLAKPDLIVDDLWSTSEPLTVGQVENISYRIKNVGNAAAVGRFSTKLWLAGKEIGTWYNDGLNVGASSTGAVNVTLSSSGTWEVKGQVDTTGVVAESNEGNNVRSETWSSPPPGNKTVILDPGHGWCAPGNTPGPNCKIDPGAVGSSLQEKDVVLDIANRTKVLLQGQGIDVTMTRTGDDPNHSLSYAAQVVNQVKPDLAVSIHANAGGGTGTEACYQDNKSTTPQSKDISQRATNAIASGLSLINRGIYSEYNSGRCGKGGQLYIHDMNSVAALIETAFIDTASDADKLRNRRQDFAQALANAIIAYLGGTPPPPGSPDIAAAREALKQMETMKFPWRQVDAPIKDLANQRNSTVYYAVIEQFEVTWTEFAGRYRPSESVPDTRCNIYAGDVMRAMNTPLPTKGNLGVGAGGSESTDPMTANARHLYEFLTGSRTSTEPNTRGWRAIDPTTAEGLKQLTDHVNAGKPAVASNTGHIAVVRPGQINVTSWQDIRIAQAGARNFMNDRLEVGFGVGNRPQFFVRD
jgi:N-acetylmuramoyl-L-alanine amidase